MRRRICSRGITYELIYYSDINPLFFSVAQSLEVNTTVIPSNPVIGKDKLKLQCNITRTSNQQLHEIFLERKRSSEKQFSTILMFLLGTHANVTYIDTALKSRTFAEDINNGLLTTVSLTFNDTQCSETAQYRWVIPYFWTVYKIDSIERISDLKVNVPGTFSGSSNYGISVSPGINVKEGTTITFKCKADVGNNPKGTLAIYYSLNGTLHQFHPYSLTTGPLTPARTCSYTQESEVYLPMTRKYNGMWFQCTLKQNNLTEYGDDYRQSSPINVTYPPGKVVVTSNPDRQVHTEGETVTLMCTSDANPPPSYTWQLYGSQVGVGPVLVLHDILRGKNDGIYRCKVQNGVPDRNYVYEASLSIIIEIPPQIPTSSINTPRSESWSMATRTSYMTTTDSLFSTLPGSRITTPFIGTIPKSVSVPTTVPTSSCSDFPGYPCIGILKLNLCTDDHISTIYCSKTCGKCVEPAIIGR